MRGRGGGRRRGCASRDYRKWNQGVREGNAPHCRSASYGGSGGKILNQLSMIIWILTLCFGVHFYFVLMDGRIATFVTGNPPESIHVAIGGKIIRTKCNNPRNATSTIKHINKTPLIQRLGRKKNADSVGVVLHRQSFLGRGGWTITPLPLPNPECGFTGIGGGAKRVDGKGGGGCTWYS